MLCNHFCKRIYAWCQSSSTEQKSWLPACNNPFNTAMMPCWQKCMTWVIFLPPTTFSNMLQIERSQEALPWNWRKFKILEKVNCANSLIIAQLGVFPLETISFWLVAPKQSAKSWNFHLYNQAINSNYLVLNPQLLLLKRKLLFPAKAKNIFNPQWLNRQCHKEEES